jgi:hypothetical protein
MNRDRKKITRAAWALLILNAFFLGPNCQAESSASAQKKTRDLSAREKVILTNIAGNTIVGIWGTMHWDYGSRSAHARMEGWFGYDTLHGGADKIGHTYANYGVGHMLARQYEAWGYPRESAARYGAYSSLMIHTVMEFGDSFSAFGFSVQDYTMNVIGAGLAYFMYRDPVINQYVDLRVEYIPTFNKYDVFTDYGGLKYLAALKLNAFPVFKKTPLQYIELKAGYYARGYEIDGVTDKQRNLYAAVGLNISRIFDVKAGGTAAFLLTYFEVPHTYIESKNNLNK